MAKITYSNKSTLNPQPSVANTNKVTSDDMNEIKTVVNTNYGEVGNITNLNTTDKSSIVGAINEVATSYIVESGNDVTTGFNYKKYSDGTSECWKNISGNINVSTAWGNGLYYGTISAETFPTDLFIEVPCIFFQNISGVSLICMNSANASSSSTGNIQVARATSNNAPYTISIRAIGKWK